MINESFLDLAQQGKPRGALKKRNFPGRTCNSECCSRGLRLLYRTGLKFLIFFWTFLIVKSIIVRYLLFLNI